MKSRHFGRASALVLALAAASVAGHAAAQTSAAQPSSPPPADESAVVEEVVVTGSYLTREDAVLPVDVVGAEELSERGSPTMVNLIKTIPSSGSVLGENNRFGGGNGVSTVNLRNLGAQRTLVLLNGRRLASSSRGGAPDVNSLPANAIQRVEVLKDGAAATYGSDAIGGVVNFITRTDLNGFELTGQYQFISGSDGDYNVGLAWGHKGDRGNILLSANYRGRNTLPVAKRDWALRTGYQGYAENLLGGWAGTGNPGVYQASTSTAPLGTSPYTGFSATDSASFNTAATAFTDIGCAANGGAPGTTTLTTTPSLAACSFQYTVFDNLVEVEQNLQLFGQVNFDLTDTTRFHAEVLYSTNETPEQSWALTGPNQWPTPMDASGASMGGGTSPIQATGTANEQSRYYVPNNNPGLLALANQLSNASCSGAVVPYGTNSSNCVAGLTRAQGLVPNMLANGLATSQTGWRPIGFGGDPGSDDGHAHYSYETSTFRVQGGFKGTFANGIGWDLSTLYQQIDYRATLQDISVRRLQLALMGYGSREGDANQCDPSEIFVTGGDYNPSNAGNAAAGCYFFNPFTNAFATSLSGNAANPYYAPSGAAAGLTGAAAAAFDAAAANRAAVIDWFSFDQPNHNTSRLFVADAVLNGELPFQLWAEDKIAWAVGAQYRWDQQIDDPDTIYDAAATPCVDSPPFANGYPPCPNTSNGPFLFNANNRAYDIDRKIQAAFVEVRFPVTEKLEFTLAGRIENYVGLGSTTNPKLSGRWQALDWLAIRGSIGSTYRAPNANQINPDFSRGLTNANGTWRASDTAGNPNLKAETADTYSVGLLFEKGPIRASVDYWNFDFKNPLTTESTTDLLNLMFPNGGTAVTPVANGGDGVTIGGGRCGNGTYVNLQGRFSFDGSCNYNNILSYTTYNINGGPIETSGYDFQINADAGTWYGVDVTAGVDGTYLVKYDQSPYLIEGFTTSTTVEERAGTIRPSQFVSYPRWRGNAFVNLSSGIHNLRWQTRYISGTELATSTSLAVAQGASTKVKAYFQHDLTYRVDLPWETQLTLQVQNVFDTDPPFAYGFQYNYDPSTVNPLGRVYSVGVKKRF